MILNTNLAQKFYILTAISFLLFSGCQKNEESGLSDDAIFQISTIDALLAGDYEGRMSFAALHDRGNFGVGTIAAVDGEMVMLDGVAYQIRVDGVVSVVEGNETTPFAVVKNFRSEQELSLTNIADMEALSAFIDQSVPAKDALYAVRIDAEFDSLLLRSVPKQSEPYPPLADVVAKQTTFLQTNISGSLVGFRFPESANGINVIGYHFHFVSDDRTVGGHVLSFSMANGDVQIDQGSELILNLGG